MDSVPISENTASGRNCVGCGRPIDWNANVCPYCGHDYRFPGYYPQMTQYQPAYGAETQGNAMPIAGGICKFLAGIIGMSIGILVVVVVNFMNSMMDLIGPIPGLDGTMMILGLLGILLEVIAMIGGVFAMMRKFWAFSLTGAVFAIIGGILIGMPLMISGGLLGIPIIALGIVGLILIAISRESFLS